MWMRVLRREKQLWVKAMYRSTCFTCLGSLVPLKFGTLEHRNIFGSCIISLRPYRKYHHNYTLSLLGRQSAWNTATPPNFSCPPLSCSLPVVVSVSHVVCTWISFDPTPSDSSSTLSSSIPWFSGLSLFANLEVLTRLLQLCGGFGVWWLVVMEWWVSKTEGISLTSNGRKHIRLAHIIAVNVSRTLHKITSTLLSIGSMSYPKNIWTAETKNSQVISIDVP